METTQLAGNQSINQLIHRCLGFLHEEDQQRFVRKFRRQSQDENSAMHTFKELLVGAYLRGAQFDARYERKYGNRTPDWSLYSDGETLLGLIEVTSFHVEREIEDLMEANHSWVGWLDNTDRLYSALQEKATRYSELIQTYNISYVVSLFGDFLAAVDRDELKECLLAKENGLFHLYPAMSGLLFFEDGTKGDYLFTYWPNPSPLHPLELPSVTFPPDKAGGT